MTGSSRPPAPCAPQVGFDVPAAVGAPLAHVETPSLMIDLDAFDANLAAMRRACAQWGVALRPHGKAHKCSAVAHRQLREGGAAGICCQKLSEAEAFAHAGIDDILIANEVTQPAKIDRLARLAARIRLAVCVDDAATVDRLGAAARRQGGELRCLVEVDVGAARCGVPPGAPAVTLAERIAATPGLAFAGLQAYHGSAQHLPTAQERRHVVADVVGRVLSTQRLLAERGLACATVTGGGTGTFALEGTSGVFTEIQPGSYPFMDADYQRIDPLPAAPQFQTSLFVLASVMSTAVRRQAVCDAGLKAIATDSGLPLVVDPPHVAYRSASDEHGVLDDPRGVLSVNDQLRLIPGHCDPTFNLHDTVVAARAGRVEALWPIDARGKGY